MLTDSVINTVIIGVTRRVIKRCRFSMMGAVRLAVELAELDAAKIARCKACDGYAVCIGGSGAAGVGSVKDAQRLRHSF